MCFLWEKILCHDQINTSDILHSISYKGADFLTMGSVVQILKAFIFPWRFRALKKKYLEISKIIHWIFTNSVEAIGKKSSSNYCHPKTQIGSPYGSRFMLIWQWMSLSLQRSIHTGSGEDLDKPRLPMGRMWPIPGNDNWSCYNYCIHI